MPVVLNDSKPLIMGVLNVTPDSFHDGGKYNCIDAAILQTKSMIEEGVDIIDIGGESTRPGAETLTFQEECKRVLPIIEAVRDFTDLPISIDTRKAETMKQALEKGASMVNDVFALQDKGASKIVADFNVPVCLMHMQGLPENMQKKPNYANVIEEVKGFLEKRIQQACAHGIALENIIIDPGFGFGKTLEHNLILLKHLRAFETFHCPILVGLSRKSMFGKILNEPDTANRLYASLAGATIAALNGANIIRTHDVKATKDAVSVAQCVLETN